MLPNGFKIKHNPRTTRGGGTAIIHRATLDIRVMQPPLDFVSFEVLDCMIMTDKLIRFCVIYRPPPSRCNKFTVRQFLDEFSEYLQHLVTCTALLIIVGDFNFHIDNENDNDAAAFLEMINSFGLHQHVSESTHRNGHTLDLALTRLSDDIISSVRSEDHGFPDHFPVFINLDISKPALPMHTVSYRRIKSLNPAELKHAIDESPVCTADRSHLNVDELATLYDVQLTSIINQFAPIKTKSIVLRPDAEWYNSTIREAKQIRRQAERRWRKTGLTVDREIYIDRRDKVNALIMKAKHDHYQALVMENKGDTKRLFEVVNKLLGKNKTSCLPPERTPAELTSMFSDFFVQKIKRIRDSVKLDLPSPDSALPPAVSNFSFFEPVRTKQVIELINNATNKSCELDPIPTKLVKQQAHSLAPIITTIINESLMSGIFPGAYKSAIVAPILKKSSLDPEQLKNYRPVSNLPFVSKLIEKTVASQLNSYLSENNLHEVFQSAYRKGHSTETALLRVHNDVICALGQRNAVILVFLDLSAAFDTVDHCRLLQVLKHLGIRGTALNWFESYLRYRTQVVRVSGVKSAKSGSECGVPQGSVLGPLLFTLYTSSLGALLRQCDVGYHFFADDSQLYLSCKISDIDQTISRLQCCLSLVQAWMAHNFLKMNEDKTEALLITSKQLAKKVCSPSLQIGSHTIAPSSTAKCLGVTVDSYFAMDAHISSICRAAYFQLRNIGHLKRYLDKKSLECVVHAFITTQLDYCNSLLCGLPTSQIRRLQAIQNTAARILTGTKKFDSITPVLRALHWLPVHQRMQFKTLTLVFKALNDMAPTYLQELIVPYSPSRALRSTNQKLLQIPKTQSNLVKSRAFSFNGPILWNALPLSIRTASSLDSFKSQLKTHLFNQYFNNFPVS